MYKQNTNLINVSTMTNSFVAFLFIHNCTSFATSSQTVTTDPDNEIHIWKYIFGLVIKKKRMYQRLNRNDRTQY